MNWIVFIIIFIVFLWLMFMLPKWVVTFVAAGTSAWLLSKTKYFVNVGEKFNNRKNSNGEDGIRMLA